MTELSVRYLPFVMLLLLEENDVEAVVYVNRLSSKAGTIELWTEAILPHSTFTEFFT